MDVRVADDDPAVRNVLTRALGRAGFGVANGAAALAEIRWHRYDAIVCDIEMPLLDGVRLYEQIEAEQPEAAQHVLFVTALADNPEVRALHERTGRPLLKKPFELPELVSVVRAVAAGEEPAPLASGSTRRSHSQRAAATEHNRRRNERRASEDRRTGSESRGEDGHRREDAETKPSTRFAGPGPMGLRRSRE